MNREQFQNQPRSRKISLDQNSARKLSQENSTTERSQQSSSRRDRSRDILVKYGIEIGDKTPPLPVSSSRKAKENRGVADHYKFLYEKEKKKSTELEQKIEFLENSRQKIFNDASKQKKILEEEFNNKYNELNNIFHAKESELENLRKRSSYVDENINNMKETALMFQKTNKELEHTKKKIHEREKEVKKYQKQLNLVKDCFEHSKDLGRVLTSNNKTWRPEFQDDVTLIRSVIEEAKHQITDFKSQLDLSQSGISLLAEHQNLGKEMAPEGQENHDSFKKTIPNGKVSGNAVEFAVKVLERVFMEMDVLSNNFDDCVYKEGIIDGKEGYECVSTYLDQCDGLRSHKMVKKLMKKKMI